MGCPPPACCPASGTPALTDTRAAREEGGLARLPRRAGAAGRFFYKNPSEDGLFAYFSEVIQRIGTGLKIYLYHFPAQSAVPFTIPLVSRLLKAYPGTVKGIKDSSGDFANTKGYVDHFANDGFEVYCGDDGALHDLLDAGGAGCITAASNVGSAMNGQVYNKWGTQVGRDAQATLAAIRKAVTSAALIPGLKALVARNTGDPAWTTMRPPHMALSADEQARLFATFDACGGHPGEGGVTALARPGPRSTAAGSRLGPAPGPRGARPRGHRCGTMLPPAAGRAASRRRRGRPASAPAARPSSAG